MIKEFNKSRIDEVMKIWLDTNIYAHDFVAEEYWRSNFEFVKEILPSSDVFIFEEENVIKGFIGIMEEGYIAGLFVKKEYQGEGIGSKLVRYCIEKYNHLVLDVFQKNEQAFNFYKKNGFKVIDEKINEDTGEIEYTMSLN